MFNDLLKFKIDNIFDKKISNKRNNKRMNNSKKSKKKVSKITSLKKKCTSENIDEECFDWIRKKTDFSQETQNALNVISLWNHNDKNLAKVVGSASSKIFVYPGDIDAMQEININFDSFEDLDSCKNFLEDSFMNLFHRVMAVGPKCVFIDFKSGYDKRFHLPFYWPGEDTKNMRDKPYSKKLFLKHIQGLNKKEIITNKFYKYIFDKLNTNDKKKAEEHIIYIRETFRNLSTIRWNIYDLTTPKDPYIKWPSNIFIKNKMDLDFDIIHEKAENKKFRLTECLFSKQRVKLDVFFYIDQNWKELTNVYIIKIKGKSGVQEITENFEKYSYSLRQDISKYHKKKNYLKVAKRLWSLARYEYKESQKSNNLSADKKNAIQRTLKLNKIYKTNVAELGQILSDLEVLDELMNHINKEVALGDKENERKGFVHLKLNKIPKNVKNRWFKNQNIESIVDPSSTLDVVWATLINQLMIKKNQIAEVFASTGLKEKNFKKVIDIYFEFMDKKCKPSKYLCNTKQRMKNDIERTSYFDWIHNDIQAGFTNYKRPGVGSMKRNMRLYINNIGTTEFSNTLPPWASNIFWQDYWNTVHKMHDELKKSISQISKKIIEKELGLNNLDSEIIYLKTHL